MWYPDSFNTNSSSSNELSEDRVSRFGDILSLTPEHRVMPLTQTQASPSIRNNL